MSVVAWNLLNAAWKTDLPLSPFEQIVVSRLACATDSDTGIAWLSLGLLAKHTKMTKLGVSRIMDRLTDKTLPVYCIDIVLLGAGRRATRYRVLPDRLCSGNPHRPQEAESTAPVAVTRVPVAATPTLRSGNPHRPDPRIPKGSPKKRAARAVLKTQIQSGGEKKPGRTGAAPNGKYGHLEARHAS